MVRACLVELVLVVGVTAVVAYKVVAVVVCMSACVLMGIWPGKNFPWFKAFRIRSLGAYSA